MRHPHSGPRAQHSKHSYSTALNPSRGLKGFVAWQGEWVDKVPQSQGQVLTGRSWLEEAEKGNVGPGRHSLCAWAMALSLPLPCPLVSVPVFIESLDTRAVPQPRSLCMDKQGSEGISSRKGGCVQP